jgi:hypothetical protein
MSVTNYLSGKNLQPTLLRIGLLCGGAYLLHLVSVIAYPPVIYRSLGLLIPLLLCGVMGFLLIALAGVRPPSSARWLILAAYILGAVALAVKWVQTSQSSDLVDLDSALYMDFATRLLLGGKNPYAWDYADVSDLYRSSQIGSTPRLDSVMAISGYPYPALSFLLLLPFQVLRLPGAFLISFLALVAVLGVLFVKAPRMIQPLVLLPLFVGVDFAELVPIGTMDIVWALLLVCMVLFWEKPAWRSVCYGLAVAFKQNAWLVAPFLLVQLWFDDEDAIPSPFHRITQFLAVCGSIFLVTNLPFLAWDPRAWFQGIAVNVGEPLAMFSQGGLSSLTQLGYVYFPKNFYFFVSVAVLGFLLFAYWRHYNMLRDVFWFIPAVFLWVTYRSINSYWLYWVFPAVAAALAWLSRSRTQARALPEPTGSGETGPPWKPTLIGGLAVLMMLLYVGVGLAMKRPDATIEPQYPLLTTSGYVDRMTVALSNNSDEVMTPRFAVQHPDQYLNPLSWHLDQGPATLDPGETAIYEISTDLHTYGFLLHEGAQIVATDASGNYGLRAVARLEPDFTYLWPEAITNPEYRVWDTARNAPTHWYLLDDPPASARASPVYKKGRLAVELEVDTRTPGLKTTALQNLITYQPGPFGIWLYLDPALAEAPSTAYGLEFEDDEHRLRVLFTAADGSGREAAYRDAAYGDPSRAYVVQRNIPVGTWTYQEIDLPALYAEVGWEPPPWIPAVFRGLDGHFQLLWLRLLVETSAETEGDLTATFGAIEQDYRISPELRMAQTLDDPAGFYIRLAQTHVRDRNYARAVEAYEQALQWDPSNAKALAGLEQVQQKLDGRLGP